MDRSSAVILAAGEGRRLRPLTRHRPKPMLPAANRPILEYVLDAVIDAGFDDLHLVVGYRRDRVQSHFGATYRNRTLQYHRQDKQLGSGHALLQARDAVDGEFVVVNGDEVLTAGAVDGVAAAFDPGDAAAIAIVESAQAPEFGSVRVSDGLVTELVEKPQSGVFRLLNAGIYALDESIFDRLEAAPASNGERTLTAAIAGLIDDGERVRAVRSLDLWVDTTYPWDLPVVAEELLAAGLVAEPDREEQEGVFLNETASVHPDATLRAPVVLGPDVTVGATAVVGPYVAVGRNADVAAGAVLNRTVVASDARVGVNATVVDSVMGPAARLGPGTTVPGGPANVCVGTEVHEDVRLGAVVADRADLRGGVTVTSGSLIGPDATISPGATVRGSVPEDANVID
jgi:glucose-1-phosphate thymidylyltransferase